VAGVSRRGSVAASSRACSCESSSEPSSGIRSNDGSSGSSAANARRVSSPGSSASVWNLARPQLAPPGAQPQLATPGEGREGRSRSSSIRCSSAPVRTGIGRSATASRPGLAPNRLGQQNVAGPPVGSPRGAHASRPRGLAGDPRGLHRHPGGLGRGTVNRSHGSCRDPRRSAPQDLRAPAAPRRRSSAGPGLRFAGRRPT
jgi:hypothetical protein